MHIRKKSETRSEIRYMVDGEEIPMVSCYKSLGCVVDEHLDLKEMVQDTVVAGKKALGAWFQRCRVEVGDVGIGTFKKLMSSLVESSMLYGAEIWGCSRNLKALEQIQLRAFRMFFGIGTMHPRVSLLLEVGDLPVHGVVGEITLHPIWA